MIILILKILLDFIALYHKIKTIIYFKLKSINLKRSSIKI